MPETPPVAEEVFDLAGTRKKVQLRIYAPVPFERKTWACHLKTDAPIDRDRPTFGEGPLQALALALKKTGADLYASRAWREGALGWRGNFGGYLGVAAPSSFLSEAPFPFDLGGCEARAAVVAEVGEGSPPGAIVVEEILTIAEPPTEVAVRIFAPEQFEPGRWRCRVQIEAPFGVDRYALGDGSVEALWRGLCLLGTELYGSALWRAGKLRQYEEESGFLGAPPPTSLCFLARDVY